MISTVNSINNVLAQGVAAAGDSPRSAQEAATVAAGARSDGANESTPSDEGMMIAVTYEHGCEIVRVPARGNASSAGSSLVDARPAGEAAFRTFTF